MGRRKSRKRIKLRPRRMLPKVFQCPRCGSVSVSVVTDKSGGLVQVRCVTCGLSADFEYREFYQPVDYYAKFLDAYESSLVSEHG
ncbi:MAG: hypothetical protein QXI84_02740 [Thermofilaceae archaeon]